MKERAEMTSSGLLGFAASTASPVLFNNPFISLSSGTFSSSSDLGVQQDLIEQQRKVDDLRRLLKRKRRTIREQRSQLQRLSRETELLREKSIVASIRKRILPRAARRLSKVRQFFGQFNSPEPTEASILAIDIRRSTDLMLHCDSATAFAEFIMSLCLGMAKTAMDRNGVFDKFTGDGILAFFPKFYSGPDHAVWALRAAIDCQNLFRAHFDRFASHFKRLPADTGLGIGIDSGMITISVMNDDIVIVGEPVVYACRFSSAASYGQTLLNQGAFAAAVRRKALSKKFVSKACQIKEGLFLAHCYRGAFPKLRLSVPAWEET